MKHFRINSIVTSIQITLQFSCNYSVLLNENVILNNKPPSYIFNQTLQLELYDNLYFILHIKNNEIGAMIGFIKLPNDIFYTGQPLLPLYNSSFTLLGERIKPVNIIKKYRFTETI